MQGRGRWVYRLQQTPLLHLLDRYCGGSQKIMVYTRICAHHQEKRLLREQCRYLDGEIDKGYFCTAPPSNITTRDRAPISKSSPSTFSTRLPPHPSPPRRVSTGGGQGLVGHFVPAWLCHLCAGRLLLLLFRRDVVRPGGRAGHLEILSSLLRGRLPSVLPSVATISVAFSPLLRAPATRGRRRRWASLPAVLILLTLPPLLLLVPLFALLPLLLVAVGRILHHFGGLLLLLLLPLLLPRYLVGQFLNFRDVEPVHVVHVGIEPAGEGQRGVEPLVHVFGHAGLAKVQTRIDHPYVSLGQSVIDHLLVLQYAH
mmetsp:Transcript_60428/g.178987  ORF Transcript_60428/g.178987 Transcript_60428/m.178987 type:complete len:313 (-) Transcript_60428:1659-2597(-)